MCGIAGVFHFSDPDKPVSDIKIERMLRAIQHRGPDESGIYLSYGIGLGSVRLSIIDIASGSQPIGVQNDRYWIVYNGELFNYLEIRKELIDLGLRFETNSDTEVVLQAFVAYGPECLNKFNGQFSIAIWDNEEHQLFLARDRAGIRPLYYTFSNGSLYFCSEVKGIFQNEEIGRKISANGLAQIFSFWTTITPSTPYENINELQPGHFIIINEKGHTIKQFWHLRFPEDQSQFYKGTIDEAIEELRSLIQDSVKIRLRADVEVAAYLSGGIDSSATTAFIHEIEPQILNTFSIGFNNKDFDETEYQLEASRYFNTNHRAFSCSEEEIGRYFQDTVYFSEYPILRTAPTPMFLLSKKVREQGIKVVITGEGADEMLAGYNIFKEAKIRRFWANQPQSHFRPLLLKKLYPYLPLMKNANSNALRLFFGYKLNETDNPYYSHLLRWHNTSRINNYLSEDLKNANKNYNPLNDLSVNIDPGFDHYSDLAKSQFLEFSVFMSGYLLSSQGDRMSMGNSVEGRYPFLDHRIIEFTAALPDNFKLNALNEKFILKKMMKGKIPDSILKRNKQAYRAPITTSFFGHNQPEYVSELLSERSIKSFGLFDSIMVNRLIQNINKGQNTSEIENMAIAGILSTQIIQHLFIDGHRNYFLKNDLKNLKVIKQYKNQ